MAFAFGLGGLETSDATAAFAVPAQMVSITRWLARLGPVLLVRDPGAALIPMRRSCAIDAFGLREALHFEDCRVYRLADSDYFGWEHVAARCAETPAQRTLRVDGKRRAHLVRGGDRGWVAVAQLSALGWEQVGDILRCEGARLAHLTRLDG